MINLYFNFSLKNPHSIGLAEEEALTEPLLAKENEPVHDEHIQDTMPKMNLEEYHPDEEAGTSRGGISFPDPDKIEPVEPWIEDIDLGHGSQDILSRTETQFWKDLIARYLYPLTANKDHQKRVAKKLKHLRDKAVTGFFMIDLLLVILMQSLQSVGVAGVDLTFHYNCTTRGETKEMQIQAVGFLFILIFGVFLVIQLFGMLAHRFFSLLQFVSSTEIRKKDKNRENYENIIRLIAQMARLEQDGEETPQETFRSARSTTSTASSENDNAPRTNNHPMLGVPSQKNASLGRRVISGITTRGRANTFKTLDQAFARRFVALKDVTLNTYHGETEQAETSGNDHVDCKPRAYTDDMNREMRKPRSQTLGATILTIPSKTKTRPKSAHAKTLHGILNRDSDIFCEERVGRIVEMHKIDDNELETTRKQVARLVERRPTL